MVFIFIMKRLKLIFLTLRNFENTSFYFYFFLSYFCTIHKIHACMQYQFPLVYPLCSTNSIIIFMSKKYQESPLDRNHTYAPGHIQVRPSQYCHHSKKWKLTHLSINQHSIWWPKPCSAIYTAVTRNELPVHDCGQNDKEKQVVEECIKYNSVH